MGGIVGRRVHMVCRECGAEKLYVPNELTPLLRRTQERGDTRVTVDWTTDQGLYICVHCSSTLNGNRNAERWKKRLGKDGMYWKGQSLASWAAKHPHVRRDALKHSAANRQAQWDERGPEVRARHKLGMFPLDLKGTFALCASCGKIVFTPSANLRAQAARGLQVVGKLHQACLIEWRGSPEMREWLSLCHRQHREGGPIPTMPLPKQPPGRRTSHEEMADMYRAAVLYFRQTEHSGRALRDELGQPVSITRLAEELHITRKGLHTRVDRFLDLLPEGPACTGRTRIWREVFRTLKPSTQDAEII